MYNVTVIEELLKRANALESECFPRVVSLNDAQITALLSSHEGLRCALSELISARLAAHEREGFVLKLIAQSLMPESQREQGE